MGGIIAASNNFTAGGNTPLSETLYEAARFYGGLSVDFGDSSNPATNHADVFSGSTYNSPITTQCQANHIVLLTDGDPTNDNEANNSIRSDFLGGTSCVDNCLDEVAGYLHDEDQNNSINEKQNVNTFTIGFATDQALLLATGLAGGGEPTSTNGVLDGGNTHYFTTSSQSGLADAFKSILEGAEDANDSFSPPALATNDFNGISHYNKLYYALFEPAAEPKWAGNIKPYTLDSNRNLIDANGDIAVDVKNMFKATSRSYWTPTGTADGLNIADGGANGRLPTGANRKLYTYTGGYDGTTGVADGELALTNADNLLTDGNTALTAKLLGLPVLVAPTATETADQATARSTIVSNTRGLRTIGAPLHSQPALVTYGGADAANADLTLFVATNDGFLHALDASPKTESTLGGRELFAFIPQELLPNLPDLANNTGAHPYGLDGDITTWVKDVNGNHDPTDTGDHVYVYVGMRRGGNNYYALDVTKRAAPVLKWVIKGGDGVGHTPGFKELGQSWSKPALATIKDDTFTGGTRKVLIFGGGYDTAQDANPLGTDDTIGRAIFIVDADTGERLWMAGPTTSTTANLKETFFTNSIPSEVRLFDSDLDGNIDRLYVGDMRGQIIRIDLDATLTNSTGTLLASLGSDTDEANHRRFYYPPDVVVTKPKDSGQATYVSLNIGSGYRAHPLNPFTAAGVPLPTVKDRFYALQDPNVLGAVPSSFTTIVNGALTDNPSDSAALAASKGWYITLDKRTGEKVLAPSITVDGVIYFTTYTPSDLPPTSGCVSPGVGRLYRVSLFDAAPAGFINDDGTENTTDQDEELDRPGIPPAPVIVFSEDGTIFDCEGTECHPIPGGIKIESTYWKDS